VSTQTLVAPTARGAFQQWPSSSGCAGGFQDCVSTANGDTSFIYGGRDVAKIDTYTHGGLPAAAAVITTDVAPAANAQCRRSGTNGNNAFNNYHRYAGTNVAGGTPVTVSDSYQNDTDTFSQAPGSIPWTVGVFNATEFGVQCNGVGGANQIRCTYIYGRANWDPGAGGYNFLLADFLLPILGGGLVTLAMMPAIARAIFARSRQHLIMPNSYLDYLAEWNAYRRPVWSN